MCCSSCECFVTGPFVSAALNPMLAQINDSTGALIAVLADFGNAMVSDSTTLSDPTLRGQRDTMLMSESQGLHRFELNVGTPAFLA